MNLVRYDWTSSLLNIPIILRSDTCRRLQHRHRLYLRHRSSLIHLQQRLQIVTTVLPALRLLECRHYHLYHRYRFTMHHRLLLPSTSPLPSIRFCQACPCHLLGTLHRRKRICTRTGCRQASTTVDQQRRCCCPSEEISFTDLQCMEATSWSNTSDVSSNNSFSPKTWCRDASSTDCKSIHRKLRHRECDLFCKSF